MRISDWSSDVCSSDLSTTPVRVLGRDSAHYGHCTHCCQSWGSTSRPDAHPIRFDSGNPAQSPCSLPCQRGHLRRVVDHVVVRFTLCAHSGKVVCVTSGRLPGIEFVKILGTERKSVG